MGVTVAEWRSLVTQHDHPRSPQRLRQLVRDDGQRQGVGHPHRVVVVPEHRNSADAGVGKWLQECHDVADLALECESILAFEIGASLTRLT